MSVQVEIGELYSSFFEKSTRRLKKHLLPNQEYHIAKQILTKYGLQLYEGRPMQ